MANRFSFRMREVIDRAKHHILLQIWEEDAPDIRESLLAAAQRGMTISVVAYGEPDFPFARVYSHEPGAEEIAHEFGGRWIILSSGDRHAYHRTN